MTTAAAQEEKSATSNTASIDYSKLEREELLRLGKEALSRQKGSDAVEALSALAEKVCVENGGNQLHPDLGPIWFLYGKACYLHATQNIDILNQNIFPVLSGNDESGDEEEALAAEKKGRFIFEDEGNGENGDKEEGDEENWEDDEGNDEEEEEEYDGPNADDVADEFKTAWEALETARLIFSSQPNNRESQVQLAEVYRALGELQLDEGKFQEAIGDLRRNLELKLTLFPAHDRLVCEAQYMLAVALESVEEYEESLDILRNATANVKLRISLLNEALVSPTEEHSSSVGKEKFVITGLTKEQMQQDLSDLEALVPDLESRIEDFEQLAAKKKQLQQEASSSATASTSSSNSSAAQVVTKANDISSLIKKKPKTDDESNVKRKLEGKDNQGDNEQKKTRIISDS